MIALFESRTLVQGLKRLRMEMTPFIVNNSFENVCIVPDRLDNKDVEAIVACVETKILKGTVQ